jgi:Abortive infection alpha
MTPIETKALDETVKSAKTILGKLFGPAADEFGMQLADNMRVRRLRNQLKCLEKVQAIVEKEGVTMKQIDFKALFPLMEGTALEEDDDLQNMWANLFTNYIDAAKLLGTHVYPDILRQLSSDEVQTLKTMMGNRERIFVRPRNVLMGTPNEPWVYLDQITNLLRLGIVEDVPEFKNNVSRVRGSRQSKIEQNNRGLLNISKTSSRHYKVSEFGLQFIAACSR